MRNNYVVRAQKFIQQFASYLENCEDQNDFAMAVLAFNKDHNRRVRFNYGSTRVVFITSDYVIKLTFGNYRDIKTFGGNEEEYKAYQSVKDTPYSYLFAETTKYQYNNWDWYIMPFISGVGSKRSDAPAYIDDPDACDFITYHFFDLHCWNFGWKDNHIVLIDYAAWRG